MKIKVAATSESRGSRNAGGSSSSTSNAAVITVTIVITVTAMFAARHLVTVQQTLVKAGSVPRLYNALITTDQKLLPSQTEPLVRPVLSTFGYAYDWLGPYAAPVYAQAASAYAQDGTARVQAASDYARTGTSADVPSGVPNGAVDGGVDERKAPSIKNNRPIDPSVPDVPPPPIPVGAGKKNKKKPEEYPPPPVGFAI